MFENYIIMYNMSKKINEIAKKSNEKLNPIINSIKIINRNINITVKTVLPVFNFVCNMQ